MSLEFPFAEVTEVDVAFGGIPNYDEVLAACPPGFYENNEFSRIASSWFNGTFDPAKDLAGLEIAAKTIEDAVNQRMYVETWLGSFRPSHQEKLAVTGWLLSLMLLTQEDIPATS